MTEREARIEQALFDAGLTEAQIQGFLTLWASDRQDEALRLLGKHRCGLLCRMHEAQKPIDILDYLLCELKKERRQQAQNGQTTNF